MAKQVFIITVDGTPWDATLRRFLEGLLAAGDSIKILGSSPPEESSTRPVVKTLSGRTAEEAIPGTRHELIRTLETRNFLPNTTRPFRKPYTSKASIRSTRPRERHDGHEQDSDHQAARDPLTAHGQAPEYGHERAPVAISTTVPGDLVQRLGPARRPVDEIAPEVEDLLEFDLFYSFLVAELAPDSTLEAGISIRDSVC
ncbi:hypothetical protein QBC39DRAFT_335464 [Podospora conica]|nr:hypothetical protein QBC39DRAFT_335464 [Schizothecium conicum]